MGGTISQEELESWTIRQEREKVVALERRINQLERQCAVLAAEIDRMRDAGEVCRLLSTLDWIVGYELVGENQTILDRAQGLALKVTGMDNPKNEHR